MVDLMVAGMLMAFLVALAVSAVLWGHDSRDGIESDEYAKRTAWLAGRR